MKETEMETNQKRCRPTSDGIKVPPSPSNGHPEVGDHFEVEVELPGVAGRCGCPGGGRRVAGSLRREPIDPNRNRPELTCARAPAPVYIRVSSGWAPRSTETRSKRR